MSRQEAPRTKKYGVSLVMDGLYPGKGRLQLDLKKGEAILPELGQDNPISLALTPRAKRFKAVIRDGQPTLVIPRRATQTQVKEILIQFEPWFVQAVEKVKQERAVISEDSILLLGREVPLLLVPDQSAWARFSSSGLSVKADSLELGTAIGIRWLYRQAEARIRLAVEEWGPKAGFHDIPFRVVETASRWGSCVAGERLAFCWRMVMAPPPVTDYLAVHEICHMKHQNHSAAYWTFVESLYPEYQRWDTWLSKNGSILMNLYPKQSLTSLRQLRPFEPVSYDDLPGFRSVFGFEDEL